MADTVSITAATAASGAVFINVTYSYIQRIVKHDRRREAEEGGGEGGGARRGLVIKLE